MVPSLRERGKALREVVASDLSTDPRAVARSTARADRIVEGRFPCLGYGVARIPTGRGWHRDPFHGFEWDPETYFARCDFVKRGERCDVKVPWELSRFQWLLWLAEGAILAPDRADRYAARAGALMADWIAHNPVGFGIHWTSAMEVAIRGINLTLALATLWEELDPDLASSAAGVLLEHLLYLKRFPEVSDVSGNHYLASLMGVSVLAPFLGHGERAAGFERFFDEAERQFAGDGCHIERAPRYQVLCLEMVLLVTALAGAKERNRGSKILNEGFEFCRLLGSKDGFVPIFGDSDDGRVLWFGRPTSTWRHLEEAWDSLAGTDAGADSFAVWVRGLHAAAGRPGWPAPVVRPRTAPSPVARNLAGFLVLRDGPLVVVMRTGPLGLVGRAPHDHDDGLSLWVLVGSTVLVAEGGCHSYTLDPGIRLRDLGSDAHNVLWEAGSLRSRPVGGSTFLTVRGAPTAEALWCRSGPDGGEMAAEISVDGRTHRREVTVARPPGGPELAIQDHWRWPTATDLELRWHLGPGVRADIGGEGQVGLSSPDPRPLGRLVFDVDGPCSVASESYIHSARYGASEPGVRLVVGLGARKEGRVTTRMTLAAGSPPP